MYKLTDTTKSIDISSYLTSMTWAGDLDSAGRKLEFMIAYTTNAKDKTWTNILIDVGDRVQLVYTDDLTQMQYILFDGVVFLQNRASESYTMEFCAFDNLIYLSKSKMSSKFSQITIKDCITQVCNTLGVTVGDLSCDDLSKYKVNFVADAMAGSDIIKKALEVATAWTGWRYHVFMAANKDKKQVLNVVRADTVIDNFTLTSTTNIIGASHGSSIEEMVNQVCVVDKDGNSIGYVKNDDDVKKYGLLQDVYKVDDKKDTKTAAKAMLKKLKETSSVTAIGNIFCISGYGVQIQEEQITGKFMISSDSHKFENNTHMMSLDLVYIVPPDDSANASTAGTLPAAGASTGSGGSFSNSESGVYSKMKQLGLTDNQAAGIMGNIKQEDPNFDPTTQNPQGYTGLFQLDPNDRWPKYVAFCNEHGWDPYNDSNQVEYVLRYENGDIRSQIPDDPQQAATWWNENVERSGDTSGVRESNASDYKAAMDDGSLVVETQTSTSSGNSDLDAKMEVADSAWIGVTTPYHTNGCVYAATGYASYYSPWAAKEFNNGVVGVKALVTDAKNSGMYSTDFSQLEAGDIIVYGDNDHVVVARGGSGDYVGNSSSKDEVVHGGNFYSMGGMYPVGIIKTSHN